MILLLVWSWVSYQQLSTTDQSKFCLVVDKAPTLLKLDHPVVRYITKNRVVYRDKIVQAAPKPKPKVEPEPAPPPPPQEAPPPPKPVAENPDYLKELLYRIEVGRRYPPQSVRYGEEGSALIQFRILPDGRLKNIEVSRSSGYPRLDQGALEAVARVSPYDPIPPGDIARLRQEGKEYWDLKVEVAFGLTDKK